MEELFTKYNYTPDKEAIAKHLNLLASNLEQVVSEKVLKGCFSIMDLTTLSTKDTVASVKKLADKVPAFAKDYPDWPLPASVCVYPNFAPVVKQALEGTGVHVTTVAGCFPTSQSFLEVKLHEIELAPPRTASSIS